MTPRLARNSRQMSSAFSRPAEVTVGSRGLGTATAVPSSCNSACDGLRLAVAGDAAGDVSTPLGNAALPSCRCSLHSSNPDSPPPAVSSYSGSVCISPNHLKLIHQIEIVFDSSTQCEASARVNVPSHLLNSFCPVSVCMFVCFSTLLISCSKSFSML